MIRPPLNTSGTRSKPDFIVWMNVTTSAEWSRPAVGIVRVEQSLAQALQDLLGPSRFRRCVWQDGRFVECLEQKSASPAIKAVMDGIFPATAAFESSRRFLQRALEQYSSGAPLPDLDESEAIEVSIPVVSEYPLEPRPGDVLISVGLDWDKPYSSEFFNIKKKRGVHVITCCYDLIPVLFPQYCVGDVAPRFREYFSTLTWGSAGVLCISEQTRSDYLSLCRSSGSPAVATCVMPLGDTLQSSEVDVSKEIAALEGQRFLLFVSTIERRKNHEVLYRAYHILCEKGHKESLPKLVFVGMPGWGVGDLLKDIELDPLTQGLIVQFNHVSDDDLNWLYQQAFFCVYPSLYEGWGLPVAEALVHGKAVVSSDKGSLPEVGGNLVKYVSPWDAYAWADAILEMCEHPERVAAMESSVKRGYKKRTWKQTAEVVSAFVESVVANQQRFPLTLFPGYDFASESGLHVGSTLCNMGKRGYLMHGPYWALGVGKYRIEVFGRAIDKSATLIIDFLSDGATQIHHVRHVAVEPIADPDSQPDTAHGTTLIYAFEISIDRLIHDFEIRCFVRSGNVALTRVTIFDLKPAR